MKLLFLVAEDGYFYTHRLDFAKYLIAQGFEVVLAACVSKYKLEIESAKIKVISLNNLHRSKFNPVKELKALVELYKIYKSEQPDIVHHVAMKPVLYGSIIARILKVKKIVNAYGGLGFLFTDNYSDLSLLAKLKKKLIRAVFLPILRNVITARNSTMILQNKDDYNTLALVNCINKFDTKIIQGSGFNRQIQDKLMKAVNKDAIKITMVARLLKDKGVYEFVEAARLVKQSYPQKNIEFIICGGLDEKNPSCVAKADVLSWEQDKVVTIMHQIDNVLDIYNASTIAVLPSYREGLPKALLEALSCGLPIVATDVPGCRELVINDYNGYLVKSRDAKELADKIIQMLALPQDKIKLMGQNSIELLQNKFSTDVIYPQFLEVYKSP